MNQNVRLQNLRDFTVQIRNEAGQIVGTGIAVSMEGKVVTCQKTPLDMFLHTL